MFPKTNFRPDVLDRLGLGFAELRPQCPRVQALDLRIASIALTTGAVVLSRNVRDFRRVPGLTVEDWTE